MSEVAKVREALERLNLPPIQPGTLHHDVIAAFVAHGLNVCDIVQSLQPDESLAYQSEAQLQLVAAILRDAGLLEDGR